MSGHKTPGEARAFARDHLLYEIEMVAGLVERFRRHRVLLNAIPRSDDPVAVELWDLAGRNADIESFGLHVRGLVDFLYAGRSGNDAIAADFFDEPQAWKRVRPKKPPALRNINSRVGGEMAHLSWLRQSPASTWPYENIWRALRGVLEPFVENAEVDLLGEETQRRARAVIATRELDQAVEHPPIRLDATEGFTATTSSGYRDGAVYQGGTAIHPLDRQRPEPFD